MSPRRQRPCPWYGYPCIQCTAFHPGLLSSYSIVHVVGPLPERPSQCAQYATKLIRSVDLASFPVLASPSLLLWTSRLYATNSLQMLSFLRLHQLLRRSPPHRHAPTCWCTEPEWCRFRQVPISSGYAVHGLQQYWRDLPFATFVLPLIQTCPPYSYPPFVFCNELLETASQPNMCIILCIFPHGFSSTKRNLGQTLSLLWRRIRAWGSQWSRMTALGRLEGLLAWLLARVIGPRRKSGCWMPLMRSWRWERSLGRERI